MNGIEDQLSQIIQGGGVMRPSPAPMQPAFPTMPGAQGGQQGAGRRQGYPMTGFQQQQQQQFGQEAMQHQANALLAALYAPQPQADQRANPFGFGFQRFGFPSWAG